MKLLLSFILLLSGLVTCVDAEVRISGGDFIFDLQPAQFVFGQQTVPQRQISYKSYTFAVGNTISVQDYRTPTDQTKLTNRLRGQKPIGRLFLLTSCSSACAEPNHRMPQAVYMNASKDPKDNEWKEVATIDSFGLTLLPAMFDNSKFEFAVNGSLVHGTGADMRIGNSSISHYYIQIFERSDPCRKYKAVYGPDATGTEDDSDYVSIDLPWTRHFPQTANGIVVGAPKVYDTYALMALRNDALQKIKLINPFLASSLTGAYGNVQGITRDQSFLSVQGQLAPPQIVPSTAAAASASSPIPAAPSSSPLTPPGTVAQASSDTLVEQVQLSGQLQTYQLLLEGAQSDALYVQNSRAIANRAQTTVSFPISIDPPRQFRHAVAEVRVLIEPFPTADSGQTQPVSIVNLLPSQKTYNVAKITSKQRAFGGAAVIEQVASVGVSGGKAKDRLYLAKDTDTVALEYNHPAVKTLRSPFPDRAFTGLEAAVHMQRLDECENEWFAIPPDDKTNQDARRKLDSSNSRDNSVLFGWQFRPVLGADYVAGGPRQVFAQLALPESLDDSTFLPAVLIQTRWREYDEKRQVVGPVFHSSCTVTSIQDPVIIQNPLRVNDTTWDDVGRGLLKIRAHGIFLSPSISMRSGNQTYPPVTFDGHDIQFFAPAKDLLTNGEISLLAENNSATPLTIPLLSDHAGCEIGSTGLWAIPQADGTARMTLVLWPDAKFKTELKNTKPLVLIGSDVYGLKDKPFESAKVCDAEGVCLYQFTGASDTLRSASNYYLRDISWSNSNLAGSIHFAPLMSKLSKYYDESAKTFGPSVTYLVSGSDLKILSQEKTLNLKEYSIELPRGKSLDVTNLSVLSDSEALLTLPQVSKGKTISIAWTPSKDDWPLSRNSPIVWDLTIPTNAQAASIAPSPAFLNVGDSRTVNYSGVDFSTVKSVIFEKMPALAFKFSPDDPKSIDVLVPTSVTREPGHKELIAITRDKKGNLSQLVLPIDVFKQ